MSNNAADAEVFVYTGPRGIDVPDDVVRVQVDHSVTSIPARAFCRRKRLAEVELCEGLMEIGEGSFAGCGHTVMKINILTSLRNICNWAFARSLRTPIRLHDGIESIGRGAFAACIFTNFRVPPLITSISYGVLTNCSMISVEIPHNITVISSAAFCNCHFLQNVAFLPNAVIGYNIFFDNPYSRLDLTELFGSETDIIRELKHRFDGLPIHKLVYYQSYHQGMLQIDVIHEERALRIYSL